MDKRGIFALFVLVSFMFVVSCSNDKEIVNDQRGEMIIYPKEFVLYQDYIDIIGGTAVVKDTGTIEATVISLKKSSICPYQEERCSIEPYPKDTGIIKIDDILYYISHEERDSQKTVEESNNEELSGEIKTTIEYQGKDIKERKSAEYEGLKEGQGITTIFLLTSRPVKVRYISLNTEKNKNAESIETEKDYEQTITHESGSGKKDYKSIPKEGDYFVFTTKIVEYPETSQKILPGLEVGSKFRANIYYDGSKIYVEEYEVVR